MATICRIFFVLNVNAILLLIKLAFRSKYDLSCEVLAVRQQLANYRLKIKHPAIDDFDRSFWVTLRQRWRNWSDALIIVKPETVLAWHKKRFKKFWRLKSTPQHSKGRPRIDRKIRNTILRIWSDTGWGAPKIHSELLKLGFEDVSQATVSRYLKTCRTNYPDRKKR